MCGIYGFQGFKSPDLLDKMGEITLHRGPDGEGRYVSPNYSMGMRRLSIIDIQGGKQPISSEDGRLEICYNGEIYNYIELRDELVSVGFNFKTHSDTEVIVNAYQYWGEECLEKFNGMFSFAIHDKISRNTFFARDRCGQKPFYYWQNKNNKSFVFASEIKAIFECKNVEKSPNLEAFDAYLALRYVPEPRTMFKDIMILPAGHFMKLSSKGDIKITKYWDIKLSSDSSQKINNEADALEELENIFFDSVQKTMRADVSVASYLSAGVDSSLIAYAMTKLSSPDKKVRTYSIGFGTDEDETSDAKETSKLLGTNHTEITCRPEDFNDLSKVVWHMDRPVGDALIMAFYGLAQQASKDGKVVLSGEGADEMFAGYSFQKMILLCEKYKNSFPKIIHDKINLPLANIFPVKLLNTFFNFPAFLGQKGKERVINFMSNYYDNDIFSNYIGLRTLFSASERSQLYSESFNEDVSKENRPIFNKKTNKLDRLGWIPTVEDKSGDFLDNLLKIQYREWMQDWAIIRQEKNSMAHSLEVRMPFLDHRLIEFAFKLPARMKMSGMKDKIIERKLAQKLLPDKVANRSKKPFFMPMEFFYDHPQIKNWIDYSLDPVLIKKRGYFSEKYINKLHKSMSNREFLPVKQIMSLVILEIWHQVFDM